jgi:hypothetical protein
MIDFSVYGISALVLVVVSVSAMYLPAFRATQDADTAQRIEGVNSRSYFRQPVPSLKPLHRSRSIQPSRSFQACGPSAFAHRVQQVCRSGTAERFLHYFWK